MDTRVNRAEGDVDRILHAKFFSNESHGVLVEVGAARPDFLSISALYRQLGWRIIAIEPNPEFVAVHREHGHEVLQYACGERDEDGVEFCVVDSHGANYEGGKVSFESFSALSIKPAYAQLKQDLDVSTIKVNLRRLDTILRDHAPEVDSIDIVAVDVEGWELEVLRGLDFIRYRPKALVVENLFAEEEYRHFMRERGYGLWRVLAPNDLYVRQDLLAHGGGMTNRWLTALIDSLRASFG